MAGNLIARASVSVDAPNERVWDALVNPDAIRQYMFGTHVVSDWHEGGAIIWKGEWQGKSYEDKGTILQLKPGSLIQYSHYSPLSGVPDQPENYHTVTVELSSNGNQTQVSLAQDKNANEAERAESEKNWAMMLAALKKFLEQSNTSGQSSASSKTPPSSRWKS